MTKKKKLIWRLGKLPSSQELIALVINKIITQEEAKEILFNYSGEKEDTQNSEELKSEIQFLRELVEKLSTGKSSVVEVVRQVYKPYWDYKWYKPYEIWCSATDGITSRTYIDGITTLSTDSGQFSSIKTF